MAKKSNLAAALPQESENKKALSEATPDASEQSAAVSESAEQKSYQAPSRAGKKAITGHFEPGVSKQLKLISIEADTSVQALLGEALNDLFAKYDKPPIA